MSEPGIGTRLRGDLTAALKARDSVAVAALRSALSALDNAGAVESPEAPTEGSEHVAGASAGVGSTDVARRVLGEDDVSAILRSLIEEHAGAADEYARIGRDDIAERLRNEAGVLSAYLAGPTDP
jgi:uncharacterized protein YqeY